MEILIGDKILADGKPKLIHLGGRPWILTKNSDENLILYDAICPHQNGIVSNLKKDEWVCPNHMWKYESESGKCLTTPSKRLQSYDVIIRNDKLFADLPIKTRKNNREKYPKIPPKITVTSAAGILFEWKGFNILSDPWMVGPCMLGSWSNYPPEMNINELPKLNALWISHEHSDHFHEPTLSLLDKNIPVYITKFDDGHLAARLQKLGFKNVIEIRTGEPIFLTDEIQLISFKSASIWNDSISYWKFGNFSILNVNDAGFNWTIKDTVGKVDVICQQYTGPTSSYPYVWNHLDDLQKRRIITGMNNGMLNMFKTVAEICQAEYVLPSANFFELANPEHKQYNKIMTKSTLPQVVKFFKNTKFKVLDLIPGESWNGEFSRINNRERYFDNEFMDNFLHEKHLIEIKMGFRPTLFDIDHEEMKKYFEVFSNSKLAKEVGFYRIFLETKDEHKTLRSLITFDNGIIKYQSNPMDNEAEMTMSVPGGIIQEIIRKDLSWDEAFNGFWCTFSRQPNVYNIHLLKLLYAPWRARPNYTPQVDLEYNIDPLSLSIADIIEKGGENASKIFEKYGLNCTGCESGLGETVEDGCAIHGIDKQKTKELIDELETL